MLSKIRQLFESLGGNGGCCDSKTWKTSISNYEDGASRREKNGSKKAPSPKNKEHGPTEFGQSLALLATDGRASS